MNNEIEAQLLKILFLGLLRIRALGYEGNAKACAIEADHLHNLPSLITNFESERLSYYLHIERPSFAERAKDSWEFEANWKRLEELLLTL